MKTNALITRKELRVNKFFQTKKIIWNDYRRYEF